MRDLVGVGEVWGGVGGVWVGEGSVRGGWGFSGGR